MDSVGSTANSLRTAAHPSDPLDSLRFSRALLVKSLYFLGALLETVTVMVAVMGMGMMVVVVVVVMVVV
eukprot:COSAG02_NODE_3443_length_6730_cov_33.609109_2_plen_69_part_00